MNESILSLGTDAIPGELPAGGSVRYDEIFARLETEMAKLETPAGGEVDWRGVVKDATTILKDKSKDLLVVGYLCRGLLQTDGVEGLASGLTVMSGITVNFWAGLHPQRPRARRSALEWLSERAAVLLDTASLRPHDLAHVPAASALVEGMWTALGDKFDGEDCGLASLRRRLKELAEGGAGAVSASGEVAVVAGAGGGAPTGGAGAAPAGGGGAGGPATSRAAALQRLAEVADYYRRFEPHSPVGYLVTKAIGWSDKPFDKIFEEMLKGKREAQDHVWDLLGIPIPEQQA